MKYVVALDQGTTSSRAVVFNQRAEIVAVHAIEFQQIYPKPGWVEHNPNDILYTQTEALRQAVMKAGIDAADIAAIGITNQRETAVLWDRDTGRPLMNAVVWQCRRTAPLVEDLKRRGYEEEIRSRTGLIPDAYFSGTKLRWMLDATGAQQRAENGGLCFGTVDTFLIWNLTKDHVFVTDATNASRTMLYNIFSGEWDGEMLRALNIPRAILPEVVDSSRVIGMLDPSILGREIPISGIAGDQHAALFGQACFESGMCKNTYGTGCFLLMNTGQEPVHSRRLLTTVAWQLDGVKKYALEGSVFVGGAVVQWLRDELRLIEKATETEAIALSVPDSAGVYLVPAFTGMGAPYWDMYARGTMVGLTRGAGRAHIVRAALESIAYQSNDLMRAMEEDSGISPALLRVDGGASANNFLMQFQSDISGVRVLRPRSIETTAMGAAMLAGLAVGVWNERELRDLQSPDRVFESAMEKEIREKLVSRWDRAVARARAWEEE